MKKIFAAAGFVFAVAAASWAGIGEYDTAGWTLATPSADTRVYYVSSSVGNNANDGLSPSSPKQTVQAGVALLRNGYPDHLLFKRGDVWNASAPDNFGRWWRSGRSKQEPMVIGAYGTGPRPLFNGMALYNDWGGNHPGFVNYVLFSSLHFQEVNPQGGQECVAILMAFNDVVFEDNHFDKCGMTIQEDKSRPATPIRTKGVLIRRNLFTDVFSAVSHSSCLYLQGLAETRVEENVFDRCGWNPNVAEAEPTVFNHCIYWQYGSPASNTVRDNVIMQGSSHGIQLRSSGRLEGNVFVKNAISVFMANNFADPGVDPDVPVGTVESTIIGNVVSEGEDMLPREGHPDVPGEDNRRGLAIHFNAFDTTVSRTEGLPNGVVGGFPWHLTVMDNIVSTGYGHMSRGIWGDFAWADYANNIVWNWTSWGTGWLPEATGPFFSPDRTVGTYNASLGGGATFQDFSAEIRKQSKTNWRTEYTAPAIVAYFREGFLPPSGGDSMPPARPKDLRRQ